MGQLLMDMRYGACSSPENQLNTRIMLATVLMNAKYVNTYDGFAKIGFEICVNRTEYLHLHRNLLSLCIRSEARLSSAGHSEYLRSRSSHSLTSRHDDGERLDVADVVSRYPRQG
jgi:hypothetical protein